MGIRVAAGVEGNTAARTTILMTTPTGDPTRGLTLRREVKVVSSEWTMLPRKMRVGQADVEDTPLRLGKILLPHGGKNPGTLVGMLPIVPDDRALR